MDKLIGCTFNWRWWLLEKYNTIFDKVSTEIEKELDSEPVYNKNSFKTNKTYGNEVTDFYSKGISMVCCNDTCLEVIS